MACKGIFVTPGSVILAVYIWQNKQNLLRFPLFEQILLFFIECLFNEISYENEKDIQQKLSKFAQILGIQNSTFKPTLIQKFSGIKIYNALNLPILLYGSEIWTFRKKNKDDWHELRWKFWDKQLGTPFLTTKVNEEILEELKVQPFDEKLRRLQ